jgi:hypothetical protein
MGVMEFASGAKAMDGIVGQFEPTKPGPKANSGEGVSTNWPGANLDSRRLARRANPREGVSNA